MEDHSEPQTANYGAPIAVRTFATLCLAGVLLACTACSEQEFGYVSGRVTFEGQPVVGADLEFQPEARDAAPSYARADAEGLYRLMYSGTKQGAEVGPHVVKITTARLTGDAGGMSKEKLPVRYNRTTGLVREVQPGDNVIDFELTKPRGRGDGRSIVAGPRAKTSGPAVRRPRLVAKATGT